MSMASLEEVHLRLHDTSPAAGPWPGKSDLLWGGISGAKVIDRAQYLPSLHVTVKLGQWLQASSMVDKRGKQEEKKLFL